MTNCAACTGYSDFEYKTATTAEKVIQRICIFWQLGHWLGGRTIINTSTVAVVLCYASEAMAMASRLYCRGTQRMHDACFDD